MSSSMSMQFHGNNCEYCASKVSILLFVIAIAFLSSAADSLFWLLPPFTLTQNMPRKSYNNSRNGNHGRMPSNNAEDKRYVDRDNSVVLRMQGNRHRVSFKSELPPGWYQFRSLGVAARQYMNEDVSMTFGQNQNNRQVIMRGRMRRGGMLRGRSSPFPMHRQADGQAPRPRQSMLAELNWFKVTIPYGHKYEKDYLIKNLLNYMAPDTFVPIMYKIFSTEATFYVDDPKAASKLLQCNRKITANNGFKIQVRVKPGFPQLQIDDALKERMKQVMAKRYNQATNALDLSCFHQDPDLVGDYFCALFRPVILMAVLEIVSEHIPTLSALNLEGNKLIVIERLNILSSALPHLKILYIGNNRIRDMSQLKGLKDLKLEEVRLSGNPVCNDYKQRPRDYFSDLRKIFPNLLKVDGIDLPKPISFDVEDEGTKLPPTQTLFIHNEAAFDIARQFVHQYFSIFDSDNRQPLLDAYHEHAFLGVTTSCRHGNGSYLSEDGNMHRTMNGGKRRKLLKYGRLPVVSFITQIPKTQHDLNSFTMDVNLAMESTMLVTVTGVFKELNEKRYLRYFNRTFVIVPEGSGYCVRNEHFHVADPTDIQEKQAFKEQQPMISRLAQDKEQQQQQQQSSSAATMTTVAVPSTSQVNLGDEARREMTLELCRRTNMNLQWSLKCLHEVEWNFERALSAFEEFFKLGQIPSEAFAK